MKDEASNLKALMIDDEPEVANLVKLILTRMCSGQVHSASSASDGIRLAGQERPDLAYYPPLPEENDSQ